MLYRKTAMDDDAKKSFLFPLRQKELLLNYAYYDFMPKRWRGADIGLYYRQKKWEWVKSGIVWKSGLNVQRREASVYVAKSK